jgi:hypothetical protein
MKFFLRVLCAFAVISAFGCHSAIIHPISTKTELGQPVTMTEPQRTGDPKNIPAGVKRKDIKAHWKTKSGAENWVDKKGNVYQNEQAQQENATPPDIPARPWYFWPAWGLAFFLTGALIILLLYLRGLLAPVLKLFKRP